MILLPTLERLGRRALRARGFTTRFVSTPIGKVHVYDARGEGTLPTMVVLHGITSAATAFAPVLMRLRKHARRVIALDHPGHGFSELRAEPLTPPALYEAAHAVLDEVLSEPAILIGNSLGGAVALERAVTRPETVRALVLLSPAGSHASDDEWARIRNVFSIGTPKQARDFFARVYHRPPRVLGRLLSYEMPAAVQRRPIRELLESAHNGHAPTPEALAALTMPILFVWGRSERLFSDHQLRWFKTHLPGHAVVERPEGFGHCPHLDAPAALAARIVRFARELPTDQRAQSTTSTSSTSTP